MKWRGSLPVNTYARDPRRARIGPAAVKVCTGVPQSGRNSSDSRRTDRPEAPEPDTRPPSGGELSNPVGGKPAAITVAASDRSRRHRFPFDGRVLCPSLLVSYRAASPAHFASYKCQ